MPSGEYDTPGPYEMDGPYIKRGIYKRDEAVFMHTTDQAEREEFIGLLNKGTHFEGMMEALKHARDNCIGHPDQMIDEAIAKAEAK